MFLDVDELLGNYANKGEEEVDEEENANYQEIKNVCSLIFALQFLHMTKLKFMLKLETYFLIRLPVVKTSTIFFLSKTMKQKAFKTTV